MKRNITIAITMTVAIMIFASQAVAQSNFKDLSLPEVWQGKKETVFGKLAFDHGMPTAKSADALYESLDAYRATELFLWSQPIVSFAKWREEAREKHVGFKNRAVLHTKTRSGPHS